MNELLKLRSIVEDVANDMWGGAVVSVSIHGNKLVLPWGELRIESDRIVVESGELGLRKSFSLELFGSRMMAELVSYAAALALDDDLGDEVVEKWKRVKKYVEERYEHIMDIVTDMLLPDLARARRELLLSRLP